MGLENYLPSWPQAKILLISASSQVAGITDVSHRVWLRLRVLLHIEAVIYTQESYTHFYTLAHSTFTPYIKPTY
jgi:hypothetical protein